MRAGNAPIDHHLVARVQAAATGAHVHEVSGLLSVYFGIAEMAEQGLASSVRLRQIEQDLRAFCFHRDQERFAALAPA